VGSSAEEGHLFWAGLWREKCEPADHSLIEATERGLVQAIAAQIVSNDASQWWEQWKATTP